MKPIKTKIKVWFTGSHNGDSVKDYILYGAIPKKFDIIATEDCDFLFVDYKDYVFHKEYLRHDCARIFYSTENLFPDYSLIDYAICPNYLPSEDRFLWMPYYWFSKECWALKDAPPQTGLADWQARNGFCCFIVSNNNAEPSRLHPPKSMREHFFDSLASFKPVDSPGKFKQNVPPIQVNKEKNQSFYQAKIDFMRGYRFALTFENSQSPGYTTEKIVHALLAGCIPIYWGDPLINKQIDENCFIWVKDEEDVDRAIETLKRIEADPSLASKYLVPGKKCLQEFENICRQEYVSDFLNEILSRDPRKAIRRSRYSLTEEYQRRMVDGSAGIKLSEIGHKIDLNIPLTAYLAHTPDVIVRVEEEELIVEFSKDIKGYVQTFGGRFKNAPLAQYLQNATIPDNALSISLGLKFSSSIPVQVTSHIMQYGAEKQIRSDFKDSAQKISGELKIDSKIIEGAHTFKFAIRIIRTDLVSEPFSVKIHGIQAYVTTRKEADNR